MCYLAILEVLCKHLSIMFLSLSLPSLDSKLGVPDDVVRALLEFEPSTNLVSFAGTALLSTVCTMNHSCVALVGALRSTTGPGLPQRPSCLTRPRSASPST